MVVKRVVMPMALLVGVFTGVFLSIAYLLRDAFVAQADLHRSGINVGEEGPGSLLIIVAIAMGWSVMRLVERVLRYDRLTALIATGSVAVLSLALSLAGAVSIAGWSAQNAVRARS